MLFSFILSFLSLAIRKHTFPSNRPHFETNIYLKTKLSPTNNRKQTSCFEEEETAQAEEDEVAVDAVAEVDITPTMEQVVMEEEEEDSTTMETTLVMAVATTNKAPFRSTIITIASTIAPTMEEGDGGEEDITATAEGTTMGEAEVAVDEVVRAVSATSMEVDVVVAAVEEEEEEEA